MFAFIHAQDEDYSVLGLGSAAAFFVYVRSYLLWLYNLRFQQGDCLRFPMIVTALHMTMSGRNPGEHSCTIKVIVTN